MIKTTYRKKHGDMLHMYLFLLSSEQQLGYNQNMFSPKPAELWHRVVENDAQPSTLTSNNVNNSSFIKSGQRTTTKVTKAKTTTKVRKSTCAKVLRTVNENVVNKKYSKKKRARTKGGRGKKTIGSERGKIIIGPRLKQRAQSEAHSSVDEVATLELTTATPILGASNTSSSPVNSPVDPELEGEDVVNVDTRKIFSLTDVNLPTPVRTRLVKVKTRPSSSPSSRPAASSLTRGSGASAAKSLRPGKVKSSTLETALPKGPDTNLNTWFSKLESAEQEAACHQGEADRMSAQVGMWERKYRTLEKEVRTRESAHHERILSLQEAMATMKQENEELQHDVSDVHEARREDAKVHNDIMEKWKRRETNLESVRHEALVEEQLLKSRLSEQKQATASAIGVAKQTKETLGTEVARLRKQLATKNEKDIQKVEHERLRLEREVSRLKNEIKRVQNATKSDVAAAAAAAAAAAYDVAQQDGGSDGRSAVGSGLEGGARVPKFNQSSKERIAKAEGKQKELEQIVQTLELEKDDYEKELKCAKKEAATATSFVRRKVEELQNEIECLHVKLQERKRELDEQRELHKEQETKWKEVQRDIGEDTKKRRELGHMIATTEQKARETAYALSRAETTLEREKDEHEKTVETLKETTEKYTTLKVEHEKIQKIVKTTVEEKKAQDKETLKVLKEMKKMEDTEMKMNKDKNMLEEATKEQKGLLQDATRSIRGYVFVVLFFYFSFFFRSLFGVFPLFIPFWTNSPSPPTHTIDHRPLPSCTDWKRN